MGKGSQEGEAVVRGGRWCFGVPGKTCAVVACGGWLALAAGLTSAVRGARAAKCAAKRWSHRGMIR